MKPLETSLLNAWPQDRWRDVTVLLAVSGGADSVALVRGMAALRPSSSGRLVVAHYNHGLRGAESDADERFVVELAGSLGLEVHVGKAPQAKVASGVADHAARGWPALEGDAPGDTIAASPGTLASEERSRASRYSFLAATAQSIGARYVATAHTADDQAETVLHRIVRGTGLAGLAGIRPARELLPGVALVRPLLAVRRSEVLAYLAELEQSFREDSSNRDRGYTRNRLRHELLPQIAADYNPQIVDALLRLGTLAAGTQEFVQSQATALAERATMSSGPSRILLDTTLLAAAPPCLVREALMTAWRNQRWPMQSMGYDEWELLAALATRPAAGTQGAKRVLPGEILVERTEARLSLARSDSANAR